MKRFNKKIILIIAIVLCLCLNINRIYAKGNVSYEGQSQGFIFKPGSSNSPTDLFENFKNIMPGDEITETIEVINNSNNRKKVKIYMKALGSQNGSDAFLSQLHLTVKEGGKVLFNSAANRTDQLSNWVLLGEFNYGDKKTLDLTLSVPIELNNDYQNAIGYLSWSFKVEDSLGSTNQLPVPNTSVK